MKFFQTPNKSLTVTLIAGVVGRFSTGSLYTMAEAVFVMAGTVWSYGEITAGINWFRRLLGLVVLIAIFLKLMRFFAQPLSLL
jgi:hypothetical protein